MVEQVAKMAVDFGEDGVEKLHLAAGQRPWRGSVDLGTGDRLEKDASEANHATSDPNFKSVDKTTS